MHRYHESPCSSSSFIPIIPAFSESAFRNLIVVEKSQSSLSCEFGAIARRRSPQWHECVGHETRMEACQPEFKEESDIILSLGERRNAHCNGGVKSADEGSPPAPPAPPSPAAHRAGSTSQLQDSSCRVGAHPQRWEDIREALKDRDATPYATRKGATPWPSS
jgi:hypothetical protein